MMTSAYGQRWTSVHGDNFAETSGRVWAVHLSGLDLGQIKRGIGIAISQDWPPSLSEFKAMCLGVESIGMVKLRIMSGASKNRFTCLVERYIPFQEWRMASHERQEKLLNQAWHMARDHLLSGGAMPEPLPAAMQITAEEEIKPLPPIMMTAHEAMADIKKTLRIPEKTPEKQIKVHARKTPEACVRCNGSGRDPVHSHHVNQQRAGECLACFGSGNEMPYNRIINPDGSITERL